MRIPTTLASLLLLAFTPPALAKVIIVDASNGPGTDYVSVFTACNFAADGDVILVRSGNYGSFTIENKGLTLTPAPGASVVLEIVQGFQATIRGVPAGKRVVVRGFDIEMITTGSTGPSPMMEIYDNDGDVWVEECESTGLALRVDDSASVTFVDCTWQAVSNESAMITSGSKVTLVDTVAEGGPGTSAGFDVWDNFHPASPGGHGLVALGSNVVIERSRVAGGKGGSGYDQFGNPCAPAKGGGSGVLVTAGSVARVIDTLATGGAAGKDPLNSSCAAGAADGEPVKVTSGTAFVDPTPLPAGPPLVSPVREGDALWITGSPAPPPTELTILGLSTANTYVPALSANLLVSQTVTVVPTAALVGVIVPELGAGIDAVIVYAQSVQCTPGGACQLGGATAVVLVDSQF